jgi:hypothetical protein
MRHGSPSALIFLRVILLAGFATLPLAACSSNAAATGSMTAKVIESETPEEAEPATVETRLTELFDLCRNGDVDEAAAYFVYRGPDKSREWKDTFRASDPLERAGVKELCRRITGYLDESEAYVFGEVKVERESEGVWHALEVSFQKEDKSKKVIFAFLKIKGRFAIGDIDE